MAVAEVGRICSRGLRRFRRAKARSSRERRSKARSRSGRQTDRQDWTPMPIQELRRHIKLPPRDVKRKRAQQPGDGVRHACRRADRVRFGAGEDLRGEREQRRRRLLAHRLRDGRGRHRLVVEVEAMRFDHGRSAEPAKADGARASPAAPPRPDWRAPRRRVRRRSRRSTIAGEFRPATPRARHRARALFRH